MISIDLDATFRNAAFVLAFIFAGLWMIEKAENHSLTRSVESLTVGLSEEERSTLECQVTYLRLREEVDTERLRKINLWLSPLDSEPEVLVEDGWK